MNRLTRLFACVAAMAVMLGLNAQSALAIPGFNVVVQDELGEVGGQVNDVNEAEFLLANGGAAEASAVVGVINFGNGAEGSVGGDTPFPGGFEDTEDFAVGAQAFTVNLPGEYGAARLAVNSDDGFRVRINGNVVGEFVAPRGSSDTFFDVAVANGDNLELAFFERGGGDQVELLAIDPLTGAREPLGSANSPFVSTSQDQTVSSGIAQSSSILGFNQQIFNAADAPGAFGDGDGLIENINEAEELVALGNAAFTGTVLIPSIGQAGGPGFPNANADDFAMTLNGVVDVLDGTPDEVFLYVDGDDGFRLRVNGDLVSEFVNPTGSANTLSGLVALKDGDVIDLVFFERGGGQFFELSRDLDGNINTTDDRFALNAFGSGIRVLTEAPAVPEPATAILGLMGLAGMGLRRRRRLA